MPSPKENIIDQLRNMVFQSPDRRIWKLQIKDGSEMTEEQSVQYAIGVIQGFRPVSRYLVKSAYRGAGTPQIYYLGVVNLPFGTFDTRVFSIGAIDETEAFLDEAVLDDSIWEKYIYKADLGALDLTFQYGDIEALGSLPFRASRRPPPTMVVPFVATPGKIVVDGQIVDSYGANHIALPLTLLYNGKLVSIYPATDDWVLDIIGTSNYFFPRLIRWVYEQYRTASLVHSFMDYIGWAPDTGIAYAIDPFGSTNLQVASDNAQKFLTVKVIRNLIDPYMAYGSSRNWYDAEIIGTFRSLPPAGTIVQVPFKDFKKVDALASFLGSGELLRADIQVGAMADKLSYGILSEFDSTIATFNYPGSNAPVPVADRPFTSRSAVPFDILMSIMLCNGGNWKLTGLNPALVFSSADVVDFMNSYTSTINPSSKVLDLIDGGPLLGQSAYAGAVKLLILNQVPDLVFSGSYEAGVLNGL